MTALKRTAILPVFHLSLVTSFSTQHRVVKHILGKYWHILQNYRVLGTRLSPKPQVIFRGVPSLKDKIVHNILDPPSRSPLLHNLTGYFKCRGCQVCHVKKRKITEFSSKVTSKSYTIKSLITCKNTHVVYVLQCFVSYNI